MSSRVFTFVSRMLFVVMAMTFLSPAMGAQLVADHEQLHAQAMHAADSSSAHEHDADHDQDSAHAVIGHLFLHMPVHFSIAFRFVPPAFATGGELHFPQFWPSFGVPERPFKPPRVLLSA